MAKLKYGKTSLLQAGNNKAFLEYIKALALGASEYELLQALEALKTRVMRKLTEYNEDITRREKDMTAEKTKALTTKLG